MTTSGSNNLTDGSKAARPSYIHRNSYTVQTAQVPPDVPQPPGSYSFSIGVAGPIPPLPNAHMNDMIGIGSRGPLPPLFPPTYGPVNPANQFDGIPGPPGFPCPSSQPFSGGTVGHPPLCPQQPLPNNGWSYQSPIIASSLSPRSQDNPQQPPTSPSIGLGQLGRSPHMSTVNSAAWPPPNGPQYAQGADSADPTHAPTLPQLGGPSNGLATSSRNPMNPHPSPALGRRMSPIVEWSHMGSTHHTLDAELASYPPDLIGEAKLLANLGRRDAQSLTMPEKQRIIANAEQLRVRQSPQQISGISGPARANVQGRMQNRGPMAQPTQQQSPLQQQRIGKQSSTSPGEEHQTPPGDDRSPPDRKRRRRTIPNPGVQQQQQSQSQWHSPPPPPQQPQPAPQHQQQQQQPLIAPLGSLSSGLQPIIGVGSVRAMPMTGHNGQISPPSSSGPPPTHQMNELNTPLNPAGPAPMSAPLLNTAPPMNPQQPLTVSAQLPTPAPPPTAGPMADLSFDMADMFGNGGGDFDFGPDLLSDMHLWFDPSAMVDDMGSMMGKTMPRFNPVRRSNPWFDPIVVHDGPSLDTT